MSSRAIISSRLQALNTTVRATFERSYDATTAWHASLCTEEASDSTSNVYPVSVDDVPVGVWDGSEKDESEPELGSYEVFNQRFQKTLRINRDALMDDKTGALLRRASDIGAKFAKHPDDQTARVLLGSAIGLDGVTLFSNSHPVNPVTRGGGTWQNIYTGIPLNPTNVATVIGKMAALPGPDGQPLVVIARCLVVPPALTYTAKSIAKSGIVPSLLGAPGGATAAAPISNVLASDYNLSVIEAPHLAAAFSGTYGSNCSDSSWYIADIVSPDKAVVKQLREGLQVIALVAPSDPDVWRHNVYKWTASVRYAFAPGAPHRIAKCTAS